MNRFINIGRHRYRENKTKGFTLLELVAVISIIALLALIAVPRFTLYIQEAEDSKNMANLVGIHTASELTIKSDKELFSKYIQSLEALDIETQERIIQGISGSYANVESDEVKLVENSLDNSNDEREVYYISIDNITNKIIVRYNTSRKSYYFDRPVVVETD